MALHASEPAAALLLLLTCTSEQHNVASRWLTEEGHRVGAHLPFGGGARMCLGYNFGLLEIKVRLSLLTCDGPFSHVLRTYIHSVGICKQLLCHAAYNTCGLQHQAKM